MQPLGILATFIRKHVANRSFAGQAGWFLLLRILSDLLFYRQDSFSGTMSDGRPACTERECPVTRDMIFDKVTASLE